MTVIADIAPKRPGFRLTAVLVTLVTVASTLAKRAIAPHRASLANLVSIPLTVIGTGCIDFAAFHIAYGWGWLVTGISLVILEHLIADES